MQNNQAFHSEDDQDVLEAIRAGFLKTHLNMQKAAEQWPPTSTGSCYPLLNHNQQHEIVQVFLVPLGQRQRAPSFGKANSTPGLIMAKLVQNE